MKRSDEISMCSEHVSTLIDEYRSLLERMGSDTDDERVREFLIRHSDWSERGATAVLHLAKTYGTFVLSNALALAEAMEIEDGGARI